MKCLGMKAVHRAVMSFFELLLSCFCFVFRQAKDRLTTTKLGHSVLADMTSSIGKHDFNVASGSGWGSTPQVSAACATRSSSLGLDARLVTDVTAGWAASQQQAKVGTCLSDVFAVAYHILPSHSLTLFSLFLFVPIWFFWSVVIIYLLIFTQLPWCISWCVLGVSLASLTAKPWATSNSCKATVLPWFEHIRTKPGCFFSVGVSVSTLKAPAGRPSLVPCFFAPLPATWSFDLTSLRNVISVRVLGFRFRQSVFHVFRSLRLHTYSWLAFFVACMVPEVRFLQWHQLWHAHTMQWIPCWFQSFSALMTTTEYDSPARKSVGVCPGVMRYVILW